MSPDRVYGRAGTAVVAAMLVLGNPGAAPVRPAVRQGSALRIVSAGPSGELASLAEADEVRIVFSEPMVPVGTVPPETVPLWIRITPAATGSFYWSGTKTLIFSPGASTPLPYATTFTVRVDASATSIAGRVLGAPYEFTFTTPTVRIRRAEWYRKTGCFDSPVVIALLLNQPMRAEDIVARIHAALEPHPWTPPALSREARERWRQGNPKGLARFDEKVASVRRVASTAGPVEVRAASSWDESRFPPVPERVVIETTTTPPPDSWLKITIDRTPPAETGAPEPTVMALEPTFFVRRTRCATACDPSGWNPIELTRLAGVGALARALTVADVTRPRAERALTTAGMDQTLASATWDGATVHQLGFARQPPASTWRLEVAADLQAADGQTLGYPWVGFVENAHEQPFVALDGSVWEASGGARVPVSVRNVVSMRRRVTAVASSMVMPRLLELRAWRSQKSPAFEGGVTERLDIAPDAAEVHGLDVGTLLSPRGTGIVSAAVVPGDLLPGSAAPTGDIKPPALLQVTNLGITVKDSPRSTLVFVTRLDSGEPVPDAAVAIVDASNHTRWRGTTDPDGIALAPALALRQPDNAWALSFIVTATKNDDVAFVAANWFAASEGLHNVHESVSVLRGDVFTDRGVYRQAEDVHFKAIVREDGPGGLQPLAAGAPLEVVIGDDSGREVDRRVVPVSAWSSAEWTWRVPADARLGYYWMRVSPAASSESDISGSFLVAAYRRPDFRVEATLTATPPVLGSPLRGAIAASYLFGGAVGTRPVRWWLTRTPVQAAPPAVLDRYPEGRYAIGYRPREGEQAAQPPLSRTESLDADGRTSVEVPTAADVDFAYAYTFNGDVEAVSGQHIASRTTLVVHPAALYIAMSRPSMFVDTDQGTKVGIVAVDLSGETVANVPVSVSLLREQWAPTRASGGRSGGWERREIPAGQWNLQTGAGETSLAVPVHDGGSYILRATARDASGRATRTEVRFYGLGRGRSAWRSEGSRIDLIPERATWKPGDTARILIQSPWPSATALLTTEREGIRSHRRFRITSTQDTVDVPITEADVPNIFVSVLLVKGRTSTDSAADDGDAGRPSFRVGYTELSVNDSSKRLHVDLSSDREEYRPRQPLKVSVVVAAPDGRPAPAEVTLWAVDHALLSLTGFTPPDVLKAIYNPRTLQVATTDNRLRLIRRTPLVPDRSIPGGVAGGIVGGVPGGLSTEYETVQVVVEPPSPTDVGIEIRHDFRPLVFWLGSATTDSEGRLTTTVNLPDSLTTYRIMAVAGDMASEFGWGDREVRVTKPLALLPAFPRFLNAGDRASFSAVVTNNSLEGGSADVTIESLDPATLEFAGVASRAVRLAAGATERVTFEAHARASGSVRVRVVARLGAESDGFVLPVLVTAPIRVSTAAAYGETTGVAIEKLDVPPGSRADAGGLTVDLASTALVGLGEGARYVDDYPYDCAEQTASKALARLLASDVGGAFTLPGIEPDGYRAAAARALQTLWNYQCVDGFALWPNRCETTSPYLTAYVLHVMKVADALHVAVDREALDAALDALERDLTESPPNDRWWSVWAVSQAYAVKVLSEYGRRPASGVAGLVGVADRLPVVSLSYLADALAASGDRGPRYQEVIRRLTNALRIDGDRAHVEEIDDSALGWLWNTNVSSTAVVLDGLSRRGDAPSFVAPLARWLVASRIDGRWGTTHENALALEALTGYYRAFETDVPQMTATVKIGSAVVGTAEFSGRSTTAQQVSVSMSELLPQLGAETAPTLSISSAGTGRIHYTARLHSLKLEPPDALDRGFAVERRYQRYVEERPSAPTTTFSSGDLVKVTIAVTVRGEGRYLALTDPFPAGFEPIEAWFRTTAQDLARQASLITSGADGWGWLLQWRLGGFDQVERHDDRVVAFATWLGSGRHEFSYLVRATTAGTFRVAGARIEAMYAPELEGRSRAAVVVVK